MLKLLKLHVLFLLIIVESIFIQNINAAEKTRYQIDDVIVTAGKRKENIQKIPAPVTAFGETEIEDAKMRNIIDIIDNVPNLSLAQGLEHNEVNFRGLGTSMFTGRNPVVLYIDGVPISHRTQFDVNLNNVERVEVLRGPQGTLYGKNAIGGVINIITKKPDNNFQGKVSMEIGEHESYGLKGYVNGPVIEDKLFFGIAASSHETGGYMKNQDPGQKFSDEKDEKNLKARLRWIPAQELEVNFNTSVMKERSGGNAWTTSPKVNFKENRNPDDKQDSDHITSSLDINYQLSFAEFKSISTFSSSEIDRVFDWNQANPTGNSCVDRHDRDAVTQELRLKSKDDSRRFKWIAGLYYSTEETDNIERSITTAAGTKMNWLSDMDDKTVSVFGQVSIPIGSKIDFTAGLRYEKTTKELDYQHIFTNASTGEITGALDYSIDTDEDALLPKAVLSLTLTDNAILYTSIEKGYLAGGLNAYEFIKDLAEFDEQTSLNYEFGTKTSWFKNKLIFNANIFYIDIEDMHVWTMTSPGIFSASNAAKAHSKGVEIELKARPFNGLDLSASYGYTDAEYDKYVNYGVDSSGKKIMKTPEYSLNLAAQYRHSSGLFLRADMQAYGDTFYNATNTDCQDAYEIYNTKIGYESGSWDIYLYCDNVFDEEHFIDMYDFYRMNTVGEPRQIGVVASIRF